MITYYIFRAIEWLNPLIYVIGFGITIWAFLRSRKKGYLVVSTYFVLILFTLLAMPTINKALAARREPDISVQRQERMNQAINEAIERVLEEETEYPPITAEKRINFPLGPILLVLGLWLIAKKEQTPNK